MGSPEYDAWVESLRGYLGPAPRDVLDIATGTGFVALIAAGLGHRVTGIDLADPMLEVAAAEARRRALSVDFLPGDAVSPPFPPASFDVLICRHFLWTLREPITALSNWRTLLRPGGRVVAIDGFWFDAAEDDMDPADAGVFEQHYTAETRRALPGMHFTGVDAVVDLFRQAGFSKRRRRPSRRGPPPCRSAARRRTVVRRHRCWVAPITSLARPAPASPASCP